MRRPHYLVLGTHSARPLAHRRYSPLVQHRRRRRAIGRTMQHCFLVTAEEASTTRPGSGVGRKSKRKRNHFFAECVRSVQPEQDWEAQQ